MRRERLGATLLEHTSGDRLGRDAGRVWVETAGGRYEADALDRHRRSLGNRMLADLGLPIHVRRKTLWWQEVDDPRATRPDRFPVFITDSPAGEIYGFPIYGMPGLKIANHAGGEVVDLGTVDRVDAPRRKPRLPRAGGAPASRRPATMSSRAPSASTP